MGMSERLALKFTVQETETTKASGQTESSQDPDRIGKAIKLGRKWTRMDGMSRITHPFLNPFSSVDAGS